MTENTKRRRSAKAHQMDIKISEVCRKMLADNTPVSARSVAKKLNIAPSSITRIDVRAKYIADAKRQQQLIRQTTTRQVKSSRAQDAEKIAKQAMEIERLKIKNDNLLASHKALYNVIREIGGAEHWDRFFNTALKVKQDIIDSGGLDKP